MSFQNVKTKPCSNSSLSSYVNVLILIVANNTVINTCTWLTLRTEDTTRTVVWPNGYSCNISTLIRSTSNGYHRINTAILAWVNDNYTDRSLCRRHINIKLVHEQLSSTLQLHKINLHSINHRRLSHTIQNFSYQNLRQRYKNKGHKAQKSFILDSGIMSVKLPNKGTCLIINC